MTRKIGLFSGTKTCVSSSDVVSLTKENITSSEIITTHCDLAGARFYPFFRALYLLNTKYVKSPSSFLNPEYRSAILLLTLR